MKEKQRKTTLKKPSPAKQLQPDIVCETESENSSPFSVLRAPLLTKSIGKK